MHRRYKILPLPKFFNYQDELENSGLERDLQIATILGRNVWYYDRLLKKSRYEYNGVVYKARKDVFFYTLKCAEFGVFSNTLNDAIKTILTYKSYLPNGRKVAKLLLEDVLFNKDNRTLKGLR